MPLFLTLLILKQTFKSVESLPFQKGENFLIKKKNTPNISLLHFPLQLWASVLLLPLLTKLLKRVAPPFSPFPLTFYSTPTCFHLHSSLKSFAKIISYQRTNTPNIIQSSTCFIDFNSAMTHYLSQVSLTYIYVLFSSYLQDSPFQFIC